MDYELSSGTIHCFYCQIGVINHILGLSIEDEE